MTPTPTQRMFRGLVRRDLARMRKFAVHVLAECEHNGTLRTVAKIRRALADIDEALKSAEADVAACPLPEELTPDA